MFYVFVVFLKPPRENFIISVSSSGIYPRQNTQFDVFPSQVEGSRFVVKSKPMKKVNIFLASFIVSAFLLTSCNTCVECTNCDDEDSEVEETCYDEVDQYYDSKSEWKEDIKEYEEETGCKCK